MQSHSSDYLRIWVTSKEERVPQGGPWVSSPFFLQHRDSPCVPFFSTLTHRVLHSHERSSLGCIFRQDRKSTGPFVFVLRLLIAYNWRVRYQTNDV